MMWAVVATLLCWFKPGVLGLAGNECEDFRGGWCFAKSVKLFPKWTPPPSPNPIRQAESKLGAALIEENELKTVNSLWLEAEMRSVYMLPELRNLFCRQFAIDLDRKALGCRGAGDAGVSPA